MESKLTSLSRQVTPGQAEFLSRKSIQWLQNRVREIKDPNRIAKNIASERSRHTLRGNVRKGDLYFFFYDPKYANELPYYDMFPLVLVLEKYSDGILGLNLHYLPIQIRAAFMDKMMKYAQTNRDNDPERIRVTYDILTSTSRLKEFKPCIKRYLDHQMHSNYLKVEPNEWEVAMFLPVHNFQKAKPSKVWKESMETIREE